MSEHDDMADESGFLSRWSRQKNLQAEQANKKEQPLVAEAEHESVPEAALKTDEDMPPFESLSEESDYTGFLSPKVSEVLRRQALRKLFHLPSLNVVDGLDDYAEDFTDFEPLGDLVTEEMKRMLSREKKKEEEKAEAEAKARADQEADERPEGRDDAEPEEVLTRQVQESEEEAQQVAIDTEVTDKDAEAEALEIKELLSNKNNLKHE
ncbi:MAG: DUF3306 domain-containing protein [Gammaproteobacteria bacterium]|nr:DUF3306 domain-containing protein [Gammaproteobacteria bacterium]